MPHLANFLPFVPHLASPFGIDPLLPMQNSVAIRAKRDALLNLFKRLGIRTLLGKLIHGTLAFVADHVMEIDNRGVREPAMKTILRRFKLGPQGPGIAFIRGRTDHVLFFISLVPTLVSLGILLAANDWIFIWHLTFDSNF
jgi:hypothetical protein